MKSITANFVVDGKPSHYELTEELEGKILIFASVGTRSKKAFHSIHLNPIKRTTAFYTEHNNKNISHLPTWEEEAFRRVYSREPAANNR